MVAEYLHHYHGSTCIAFITDCKLVLFLITIQRYINNSYCGNVVLPQSEMFYQIQNLLASSYIYKRKTKREINYSMAAL